METNWNSRENLCLQWEIFGKHSRRSVSVIESHSSGQHNSVSVIGIWKMPSEQKAVCNYFEYCGTCFMTLLFKFLGGGCTGGPRSAPRMIGRRSRWTERGDDNIFLRLAIVVRLSLLWLRMRFLSWRPLVWILYTQVRRSLGRKWPK